jgi:adenosylmethionine-8-amino-7-oxononanoate aminotransferase
MPSFCWKCGKPLVKATGGKLKGSVISVTRNYHGATLTMHKVCAEDFDEEQARDKFWPTRDDDIINVDGDEESLD